MGEFISMPASPQSSERAKAPGTAGFRPRYGLGLGSHEGEWWARQDCGNDRVSNG